MGKTCLVLFALTTLLNTACKEHKQDEDYTAFTKVLPINGTIHAASKKYLNAWRSNDIELMKSLTIDGITREANGKLASVNQEQLAEAINFWQTAMPNYDLEINQLIIKGNKSYTSWTSSGINTGMFGKTPPTGKKSSATGFTILTFNMDGKIIHEQAFYDMLGIIEAWGYTVTPPVMK